MVHLKKYAPKSGFTHALKYDYLLILLYIVIKKKWYPMNNMFKNKNVNKHKIRKNIWKKTAESITDLLLNNEFWYVKTFTQWCK